MDIRLIARNEDEGLVIIAEESNPYNEKNEMHAAK